MVYCGQMRVGMCLCPSSQYKRLIISKFPHAVKRSPAPDGAFFLPSPSPRTKKVPKAAGFGHFFVLHVRRPHPCGDRSGAYAASPLAGAAAYTPEGPPAARGRSLRLRDVYVSIKGGIECISSKSAARKKQKTGCNRTQLLCRLQPVDHADKLRADTWLCVPAFRPVCQITFRLP